MNQYSDLVLNLFEILSQRLIDLVIAGITLLVGFIIYKIIVREIHTLASRRGVRRHVAFTLQRVTQWIVSIIILFMLFGVLGIKIGTFGGILTAVTGTILGFAAVNTIGNAIAGLIVMTSKPFTLGDRIYFNDQYSDVIDIGIIYTKMSTLDNVVISVPNQTLLTTQIENYGKKKLVRRQCTITAGFEHDFTTIQNFLFEALDKVKHIRAAPEPSVRITNIDKFAVEYTLYYFISEVKLLRQIEANVNKRVLETAKKYDIDLSTPNLIRSV